MGMLGTSGRTWLLGCFFELEIGEINMKLSCSKFIRGRKMELLSHRIRLFYPLFHAPFSRLSTLAPVGLHTSPGTQGRHSTSLSHLEPFSKADCGFPRILCSSEWRFRSQPRCDSASIYLPGLGYMSI